MAIIFVWFGRNEVNLIAVTAVFFAIFLLFVVSFFVHTERWAAINQRVSRPIVGPTTFKTALGQASEEISYVLKIFQSTSENLMRKVNSSVTQSASKNENRKAAILNDDPAAPVDPKVVALVLKAAGGILAIGFTLFLGLRGEIGAATTIGIFGLGLLGWIAFGHAAQSKMSDDNAGQIAAGISQAEAFSINSIRNRLAAIDLSALIAKITKSLSGISQAGDGMKVTAAAVAAIAIAILFIWMIGKPTEAEKARADADKGAAVFNSSGAAPSRTNNVTPERAQDVGDDDWYRFERSEKLCTKARSPAGRLIGATNDYIALDNVHVGARLVQVTLRSTAKPGSFDYEADATYYRSQERCESTNGIKVLQPDELEMIDIAQAKSEEQAWYSRNPISRLCSKIDSPAEMMSSMRTMRVSVTTSGERRENGTLVEVTLQFPSERRQIVYYRGKSRCDAFTQREERGRQFEIDRLR